LTASNTATSTNNNSRPFYRTFSMEANNAC
jgi:hypothetical protein